MHHKVLDCDNCVYSPETREGLGLKLDNHACERPDDQRTVCLFVVGNGSFECHYTFLVESDQFEVVADEVEVLIKFVHGVTY